MTDKFGFDTIGTDGGFFVVQPVPVQLFNNELFSPPQRPLVGRFEPAVVQSEATFSLNSQTFLHKNRVRFIRQHPFQRFTDATRIHFCHRGRNRSDHHTDTPVTADSPHGNIVNQRRFACTGRDVDNNELFFFGLQQADQGDCRFDLPR